MGNFKIEKGIPIPKNKNPYGSMMSCVRAMKVGDSFSSDIDTEGSLRTNISTYAKSCGKKFQIHRVVENGKKVIRVWRIS